MIDALNIARSGAAGLLTLGFLQAANWPQYRGPDHNGITPEPVAHRWPVAGPESLWSVPAPGGFSSFSILNGRAVTLITRSVEGADREVCVAFDAQTGKELWATPIGVAKYDGGGDSGTQGNRGGDGPRSTPALAGDRVYVTSAQLTLTCLDAASGNRIWSHDLVREFNGKNISWQNAASAVLDGDRVFVAGGGPGQTFLAFNQSDGAVAWKSGDDRITHATPVPATLHDVRQIIFFTQRGLTSLRADDGTLLWRFPFPFKVSTAASPVVAGDLVYCSAGYGVGAAVARITRQGDRFEARELWRLKGDKPVANHWSTPVFHKGHLYGMFSFKDYGSGPLKCINILTGRVAWEKEGFGAGNVILAGETLVALSDSGELVLVEPRPDSYRELGRAKVIEGKCWSTPSLSGGRAYLRSTRQGVCIDVAPRQADAR
jgi:outer membrane protein assembly factor BamB